MFRTIPSCVLAFAMLTGQAAVPDSLSIKDKAQINKLAELTHQDYKGLLLMIAGSSAESESESMDVQTFLKNACEGEQKIFTGPDAIIQDNIDPDLKAGSSSLNRKAADYGYDLFTNFRGEGSTPIDMHVIALAEPRIAQGSVFTKVLYEVEFKGHHIARTTPYARHKRVMMLVAQQKGSKDWSVSIASDDYYDEGKGFEAFQLEKEIGEAKAAGTMLTPEMYAYQEAARLAGQEAERVRKERQKQYEDAMVRGNTFVAEGDFESAILSFKQASSIDPMSLDPLLMVTKAKNAWDAKLTADKKRMDEMLRRAEELKGMRAYERALSLVQKACEITPGDLRCPPLRDTLQARIQLKSDREAAFVAGNFEGCIKNTRELMRVRRTPDDPELLTLLGKCYHRLHKESDALKVLDQALAKEPFLGEALLLRAQIRERSSAEADLFAAVEDYNKLVTHDPFEPAYSTGLARLTCFKQKNCSKASELLKKSLERNPNDVETLYWLARVHGFGNVGQLNEYGISVAYLEQALELDSLCAVCWLERGISLMMLQEYDSARVSIKRAKRLGLPELDWYRAKGLAAGELKSGREKSEGKLYALAMPYFERACVLHPDTPAYWMDKGLNLMAVPRYEEALAAFDEVLGLVNGSYPARLKRATCCLKLDRYEDALAEVERVQRNDVNGNFAAESNFIAGEACFRKGDMGCAEKFLKEAFRKDEENASVLSMLAQVLFRSGRYKEAEKFAEAALDKDKTDPTSHFYLGRIRQQMKDANGSIKSFEMAKNYGYDRNQVLKQTANSRMLVGDYKTALLDLHELLLGFDDIEAARWKSQCHMELGQYREALAVSMQLQENHPEVAETPEFLADIGFQYVVNDMTNEANQALDAAYRADPDYKRTLLARIANFWKTSRQEDAVKELSGLVTRNLVTEKELKDWPVLKELITARMWKDRK